MKQPAQNLSILLQARDLILEARDSCRKGSQEYKDNNWRLHDVERCIEARKVELATPVKSNPLPCLPPKQVVRIKASTPKKLKSGLEEYTYDSLKLS